MSIAYVLLHCKVIKQSAMPASFEKVGQTAENFPINMLIELAEFVA